MFHGGASTFQATNYRKVNYSTGNGVLLKRITGLVLVGKRNLPTNNRFTHACKSCNSNATSQNESGWKAREF